MVGPAQFHGGLQAADYYDPVSAALTASEEDAENYFRFEQFMNEGYRYFKNNSFEALVKNYALLCCLKEISSLLPEKKLFSKIFSYFWLAWENNLKLYDHNALDGKSIEKMLSLPIAQWSTIDAIIYLNGTSYVKSIYGTLINFQKIYGIFEYASIDDDSKATKISALHAQFINHVLANNQKLLVDSVKKGDRALLHLAIVDINIAHQIIKQYGLIEMANKRKFFDLEADLKFILSSHGIAEVEKHFCSPNPIIRPKNAGINNGHGALHPKERRRCIIF